MEDKQCRQSLMGLFKKVPYGAEFNLMDNKHKYGNHQSVNSTLVLFRGIDQINNKLIFKLRKGNETITTDEYGVVEEGVYVYPLGGIWNDERVLNTARRYEAAKYIAENTMLDKSNALDALNALVVWVNGGGIEKELDKLPYAKEETDDDVNSKWDSFCDETKEKLSQAFGSEEMFKEVETGRIMTAKALYGVFGMQYGRPKEDIDIERKVNSEWDALAEDVKNNFINEYGSEENYKTNERIRLKALREIENTNNSDKRIYRYDTI